MDEQTVRGRAEVLCAALVEGDVGRATEDFSAALRQNLGEVLQVFPLPATEATVESVERGGSGYAANLRIVGTAEEVVVQTRWKDRDGTPTVVEVSHLSRTETATPPTDEEETGVGEPA